MGKEKKIDFFDSILYFLLKCYNSLNGLLANTLRAPVNRTLCFFDKIEDIYIYIYLINKIFSPQITIPIAALYNLKQYHRSDLNKQTQKNIG